MIKQISREDLNLIKSMNSTTCPHCSKHPRKIRRKNYYHGRKSEPRITLWKRCECGYFNQQIEYTKENKQNNNRR
jgi:transposase